MSTDDRTHEAVAADNVRRFLAGKLTEPMPGTLAAEVQAWALYRSAQAFKAGLSFGRDEGRAEVAREVRAAAERAVAQAAEILGVKR